MYLAYSEFPFKSSWGRTAVARAELTGVLAEVMCGAEAFNATDVSIAADPNVIVQVPRRRMAPPSEFNITSKQERFWAGKAEEQKKLEQEEHEAAAQARRLSCEQECKEIATHQSAIWDARATSSPGRVPAPCSSLPVLSNGEVGPKLIQNGASNSTLSSCLAISPMVGQLESQGKCACWRWKTAWNNIVARQLEV